MPLAGRTAIVVDDSVTTGSTARTCQVARAQGAAHIVLAVPVGPPDSIAELEAGDDIDEVVCFETHPLFMAIGQFYADFTQTSDDEVLDLLTRAAAGAPAPRSPTCP